MLGRRNKGRLILFITAKQIYFCRLPTPHEYAIDCVQIEEGGERQHQHQHQRQQLSDPRGQV
jgi:hypothetical protein